MSNKAQPRLLDSALGTHWAITREGLDSLAAIYHLAVERNINVTHENLAAIIEENAELGHALHVNSYSALQQMKGEQMGGTRYASLYPNGIAVIDLIGPIFPRANLMTMSGATSISQFTSDLVKAEAHADVKGILIHIDSPGGDVRGIGDSAKVVSALAKMSNKPIKAFVSGLGASAAYYIASAVGPGNIISSESGLLGSIGVVMSAMAKDDSKEIEIVSSQSPYKRPDASTEDGKAVLQERVDDLAQIFVRDVSKYRKVSQATVLADYGQGKVFVAPRALKQGLIDGIGTLSQVVEEMGSSAKSGGHSRQKASAEALGVESLLMFTEDEEQMALKGIIARFRASSDTLATDPDSTEQGQNAPAVGADKTQPPAGAVEAPVVPPTEDTTADLADTTPAGTTAPATQTREELEERFSDSAELFATQMMTDNRIFPAQAAHAASDLMNARIDDMVVGGTVKFVDESGQLAEGTREAAVRARYMAMPKHSMTQQAVAGIKSGAVAGKVLTETETVKAEDGPISEERKRELMGLTSAGQAAITASK